LTPPPSTTICLPRRVLTANARNQNGRYAPVEAGQPALPKGALADLEHHPYPTRDARLDTPQRSPPSHAHQHTTIPARQPAVLRRPVELAQYTSWAIGRSLRESGILQSMGSRGDAYDNAQAESFMSTLKTELIDRRSWPTRDDARRAIFDYIEGWYNPRRRHSALGYKSPIEYEKINHQAADAA
jgi:transposase InsO family protein